MTTALTTYNAPNLPALMAQGEMIVKAGIFGRKFETAAQVVAVMLAGREMGLTPMQAATELYVVNGQVGMSGKVMQALFERGGQQWFRITESSAERVRGIVHLRDGSEHEHILTYAEADNAKWTQNWSNKDGKWTPKSTWRGMPRIMLEWAWKRTAIRKHDPGALLGNVVIEDMPELPTDTAELDALIQLRREELRMLQAQIEALEERATAIQDIEVDEETGEVVETTAAVMQDAASAAQETMQAVFQQQKPPEPHWSDDAAKLDEFKMRACQHYGLNFPTIDAILRDIRQYPTMKDAKAAIETWVDEQQQKPPEPHWSDDAAKRPEGLML
ncbi:MAG: hypothetical protein FJZ90_03025 [Chloroflexi bacterium]|nr:hypothetical protein [Chloroflexota bacterium]